MLIFANFVYIKLLLSVSPTPHRRAPPWLDPPEMVPQVTPSQARSRLVPWAGPQKLSHAAWFVICPSENTASQYFRKYELAVSTIGQMTNSNTLY